MPAGPLGDSAEFDIWLPGLGKTHHGIHDADIATASLELVLALQVRVFVFTLFDLLCIAASQVAAPLMISPDFWGLLAWCYSDSNAICCHSCIGIAGSSLRLQALFDLF